MADEPNDLEFWRMRATAAEVQIQALQGEIERLRLAKIGVECQIQKLVDQLRQLVAMVEKRRG